MRTKELYIYRHKWYGISVKGGRKKCMCTLQRLCTYICMDGHYKMQGREGKVWQALTDDIHSQYNTHLSEENTGRAIRGRSVSRSCCGTPIPSPNIPISWFHPLLPFHFSPWPSKSLLSTTNLILPGYFTPSKILIMRVGWAGKPQGKQLCYRHAVPCATLSPYT